MIKLTKTSGFPSGIGGTMLLVVALFNYWDFYVNILFAFHGFGIKRLSVTGNAS